MTPKEKAKELVRQFCDLGNMDIVKSKVCALIAVDEILKITWVDKFLIVEDY